VVGAGVTLVVVGSGAVVVLGVVLGVVSGGSVGALVVSGAGVVVVVLRPSRFAPPPPAPAPAPLARCVLLDWFPD